MKSRFQGISHGMSLRDCLSAARGLGCRVGPKRRTGEIEVRHLASGTRVLINGRRKDAPRSLTQFLRTLCAAMLLGVVLFPRAGGLFALAIGFGLSAPVRAEAPASAEAAAPLATEASPGTPRQQQWLDATPEQRIRLAEALGEEGASAFARAKGWRCLLDGATSTFRQGLDQVHQDLDGVIHVIEAKGGGSPLKTGYGHAQGSSEWAAHAADRTLRSTAASPAERAAARAVLEAARDGRLQVHVVRTAHVLGEPTAAVLEQTVRGSDEAARIAKSCLDDLAQRGLIALDDAARVADDAARGERTLTRSGRTMRAASKFALPIAIGVDVGLRVQEGAKVEQRFEAGEISEEQREVDHAKNAAGMAGGWAGALVGVKVGAAGGAAAGACAVPGPGTAAGALVGGLAGGVAGYIGGEQAAEAAAEWAVKRVHATGTTIKSIANGIAEGAGAAWDWTSDSASNAWRWVFGD